MKKLLGTLSLLAAAVSPAFADSTAVLNLDVREGRHGGSLATVTFSGEAAEEVYAMLAVLPQRMPAADGIKYQEMKGADDIVCYRTVRSCRMQVPAYPVSPQPGGRFPGREGWNGRDGRDFRPGFIPGPIPPGGNMPGVLQPQPVCGVEDRVTYTCQTGINSMGKIDIEGLRRR